MIISEKIAMLRKKNDWSQEQLAEQLSVSRQSVSKWESGAAIPGMDLLVKMSELFGVSVDYLVKDEMEEIAYTGEETIERNDDRIVTLEEANTYMDTVREVASKIATGVVLCILSPVLLIFLGGYSETVGAAITENMAGGIGLVALLVIITVAVVTLILNGLKLSKYEYLEKDEISLIYGVKGIVEKKKNEFEDEFHRGIAIGVALCILSVIPVAATAIVTEEDFPLVCATCLIFFFVSAGVYLIIKVSMVWGSYQKLLQVGDYSIEQKRGNKKIDAFASIYWCVITALYLGYSFITMNWGISWIIWPVAGVLFGAVAGIIKLCSSGK